MCARMTGERQARAIYTYVYIEQTYIDRRVSIEEVHHVHISVAHIFRQHCAASRINV